MKRALAALAIAVGFVGLVLATSSARSSKTATISFRSVDVYVDSDVPLAAYEVEIIVVHGESSIVGVEGGETPFEEPPYYDPEALTQGRILLGAFDTKAAVPAGRHRVATIHVREVDAPAEYQIRLLAAAGTDGKRRTAHASLEPGKGIQ